MDVDVARAGLRAALDLLIPAIEGLHHAVVGTRAEDSVTFPLVETLLAERRVRPTARGTLALVVGARQLVDDCEGAGVDWSAVERADIALAETEALFDIIRG